METMDTLIRGALTIYRIPIWTGCGFGEIKMNQIQYNKLCQLSKAVEAAETLGELNEAERARVEYLNKFK